MGFLPIKTTIGDRIFISAITFIGIHFLWMGAIEKHLPLWIATIIGTIASFVILKWG